MSHLGSPGWPSEREMLEWLEGQILELRVQLLRLNGLAFYEEAEVRLASITRRAALARVRVQAAAAVGKRAQRESFDAVLIDCQSPAQDGAALCCQIHTLPGCAHLPVFMLALSADREMCSPGAVIDYLNKPVKFEDLQAALERRVLCC